MHRKAGLLGRLLDDFDADRGGPEGPVAGIARIGECFGHEWKRAAGQSQDGNRTVAVLDVSGLGFQD
jgi:hypothetical protein